MVKPVKKKATKKSLDAELQELVKIVAEQDKKEKAAKKLGEKSRMLAWQATARAYLWWREATKRPGYLDKLYADNKIPNNQLGNRTNFNPLVRLVWDIHGERWAHVSSLAQSIAALDEEFTENPHLYKEQAEDNLFLYIADSGGLSGVRQKSSLKFDDENAVAQEAPIAKKAQKPATLPPEVQKELLKRQTNHIATTPGLGPINIGEVAVSTRNSTSNDLIAILARRDKATRTLTAIGTTNDTALVEQLVLECVQFDQSTLTPILRLIVECLRPHVLPKALHKRHVRDKFFTTHKVKIGDDKKKVEMHELVRMVLLKDGTVLISKRLSHASLVTISKPKEVKLAFDNAIFMRGADRFWIETDLINEGLIALYTSVPSDALSKAKKSQKASETLKLEKNVLTKTDRDVYFYDFDVLSEDFQYQPTMRDPDKIKYDWEMEATKSFIDQFAAQHFDEWLDGVGDRIQLSHNKSFQLVFAKDHVEVRSHFKPDETYGYARIGPRFSSRFAVDATITLNAKVCEITISPLDIIELFATLRSVKLNGKVSIKGNSNVMTVSYETDTARHTAYIPACDVRGHRISTEFTKFTP